MKELVTGHPYTTETVLQPEADEFIILACDGVCSNTLDVFLTAPLSDFFCSSYSSGMFARIKRRSISSAVFRTHRKLVRCSSTTPWVGSRRITSAV